MSAGTAKAANAAIIAITTSSSIRVKAEESLFLMAADILEETGARVKLKRGPGPA